MIFLDVQNDEGLTVAKVPVEVHSSDGVNVAFEFCGHVAEGGELPKPFMQIGIGGHRVIVLCELCAGQVQRSLYDLVLREAADKVRCDEGCSGSCGIDGCAEGRCKEGCGNECNP